VATTLTEKAKLRRTGADAVEMEAAAVAAKAQEWNLPFYAIRVVTDTAAESFPLDFNRMRDAEGRFDRARIITAALRRPGIVFPELLKLNKRCKSAARALGEFIADSRI
jgi:nucleoside phosphorylase